MRFPIAAALLLGLAFAAPAQAQTGDVAFEGRYAAYARGIEAGVFNFRLNKSGASYQISAERRLTGFVASLAGRNQDYTYSVRGAVGADGEFQTRSYQHQGGRRRADRPNGRIVRSTFTADNVETTTEPAGMGMGDPPATTAQKRGVVDQLTAIANLMTRSGDPCQGTVRVYMDGRSRFDFVLSPNGRVNANTPGYRGEAIRCAVQFRPIAGFSDPQEAATLTFLFAPLRDGVYAPVQIEMPSNDAGVVRLQARSLSVNGTALR